mmetsp:Transcript_20870/g.39010  ORF Transcript_20870/g.39010 Transcript_20870/m.39010 type:complete len:160 (+) Transcript_20870:192-671(+)
MSLPIVQVPVLVVLLPNHHRNIPTFYKSIKEPSSSTSTEVKSQITGSTSTNGAMTSARSMAEGGITLLVELAGHEGHISSSSAWKTSKKRYPKLLASAVIVKSSSRFVPFGPDEKSPGKGWSSHAQNVPFNENDKRNSLSHVDSLAKEDPVVLAAKMLV